MPTELEYTARFPESRYEPLIAYSIFKDMPSRETDSSRVILMWSHYDNEKMLTRSWFSRKSTSLDLDVYHIDTSHVIVQHIKHCNARI